jgi:Xaa-Pro dipeptidase
MESIVAQYAEHVTAMTRRYEEATAAAGVDRVVVFAGVERYLPFDDSAYPFAATAHFRAWAPLTAHPGCAVIFTRGEQPVLFYHQPKDFWHLPPGPPADYLEQAFDVHLAADQGELARWAEGGGRIAFLGEADQVPGAFADADLNPAPLVARLNYARSVKTPYELSCLRRASDTAVRGHLAAAQAFRSGASEFEIHLAYLRATGATDGDLPYPSIVALEEHGATLHYQLRERRRRPAPRSFLIDAGADFAGYAADITRTWSAAEDGAFPALLSAMDTLQQSICAEVQAGTDFRTLHLRTHEFLAELLSNVGLIRDVSPEGAIAGGITRTFFPHGLGHFLGLQVHDVGGLQARPDGGRIERPDGHPFLRLTRTLREHEVVTIEPGLYFIPMLLDSLREGPMKAHVDWGLVASFAPFGGIRIEDDVVATRGGHENLTRSAFALAGQETGAGGRAAAG